MRLAVQLDDDLRSHALLGLHAHAGIFSVKEMDALKHVEERQAATSLDGAVGGNALGLLSAMLLKQPSSSTMISKPSSVSKALT